MKKIFTFLVALSAVFALNAETIEWKASDTNFANNDRLDGVVIQINPNLSIKFANGEATDNNYVRYRDVTDMPEPAIAFYSKNEFTLSASKATINSVQFVVLTDSSAGNDGTSGWKVKAGSTTLSAQDGDTWSGNVTELLVIGNSKTSIIGLKIEYTPEKPEVEEPDQPIEPEDPKELLAAGLFFGADQVAKGVEAQNVSLSNNGTTVVFSSNSASAEVDATNLGYFGTPDNYKTIPYRYRPGGRSTNGVNSNNKGIFTFPSDGTLIIYAFNTQADENRNIQIIQNDVTVFDHLFKAGDYETPEGKSTKIYPVISAKVQKGEAYFLWPVNQLMLFGFEFIPNVVKIGHQDWVQSENTTSAADGYDIAFDSLEDEVTLYVQIPADYDLYYSVESTSNEANSPNDADDALAKFVRRNADEVWTKAEPSLVEKYSVEIKLTNGTNGTVKYYLQNQNDETSRTPESKVSYIALQNTPTAVEEIEAPEYENAEYYTLQGTRVINPDHGIYVRVAGGRATKVIL